MGPHSCLLFQKLNKMNLKKMTPIVIYDNACQLCIKFANICSGEIIQNYGAKFNELSDYQKLFKLL